MSSSSHFSPETFRICGMVCFSCPHCSRALQVKDDLAGKKAKCPACGKPVAIPGSVRVGKEAAVVETPTQLPDAEEESPAKENKQATSDPQTRTAAESKSEVNT